MRWIKIALLLHLLYYLGSYFDKNVGKMWEVWTKHTPKWVNPSKCRYVGNTGVWWLVLLKVQKDISKEICLKMFVYFLVDTNAFYISLCQCIKPLERMEKKQWPLFHNDHQLTVTLTSLMESTFTCTKECVYNFL